MNSFVERIRELQLRGGLKGFDVKSEQECIFYPAISCIVSDNKEAYSLSHMKSGSTNKPCRFCLVDRTEIHRFQDAECYEPRSGIAIQSLLYPQAFGSSIIKDKAKLKEWLDERSVQHDIQKVGSSTLYLTHSHHSIVVLQNAFCRGITQEDLQNKSYADQVSLDFRKFYYKFPADMLHTVLGGLVRYTCLWTLTVVKVCD